MDLSASSSSMLSPIVVEVLPVVSVSCSGPSGEVDLERVLLEDSPFPEIRKADPRVSAESADLLVGDRRS